MSNLADLEIEDIQEIAAKFSDKAMTTLFALTVKHFLEATRADGGAESDLIFTTGARISRSGVWDRVPSVTLAAALRNIPLDRIELLLETASNRYKTKVINSIREVKDDIKSKPLNASFALRATRPNPNQTSVGLARRVNADVGASWIEVLPPPPGNVSYSTVKGGEIGALGSTSLLHPELNRPVPGLKGTRLRSGPRTKGRGKP